MRTLIKNKKGIYIPPLAYAILVFLLFLLVVTALPGVKATLVDILKNIFG